MSFILDALKKSESDRQRQSGPSLFEVKVAPPRRTLPVWAVAIAVLLGINIVVISWMLLRHPAAQQPALTATAPAAAPPPALPGAAISAGPVAPRAQGPAPAGPTDGAAAAGTATTGTPPAARAAGSAQPTGAATLAGGTAQDNGQPAAGGNASDDAPAVQPAATGPGAESGATGDLPLYQQIVTSDGLPALHLDLHVFADRPRDRFVMINMHRLGEGDSLPSGVQVEAIRSDGVVLTYRGTRFLLPRN